jgi:hypothetical protein
LESYAKSYPNASFSDESSQLLLKSLYVATVFFLTIGVIFTLVGTVAGAYNAFRDIES